MTTVVRPVTLASINMLVCIDSYDNGDMDGVMYNRLMPEPLVLEVLCS